MKKISTVESTTSLHLSRKNPRFPQDLEKQIFTLMMYANEHRRDGPEIGCGSK